MVVGDDWQAIYSFRAATVKNILRFSREFRPKARIIKLEQNYRSPQPVLDACNAVIALLQEEGYAKQLWSNRRAKIKPALVQVADERDQTRMIAQQIINARNQGVALKDQAVLFRDARHSAQLELELTRRRVPFRKFGGFKFYHQRLTVVREPPGSFGGREGTAVAAGRRVFSGHQNARPARW
jgi:DNA helicase II / ATP-dependent DNA helicase PcrA